MNSPYNAAETVVDKTTMNKLQTLSLTALFSSATFLTACGSGPSTSSIRSDLDNPTGSIQDQGGVSAAGSRSSNSGFAASFGGTTPFGPTSGLTALNGRGRFQPLAPLQPMFNYLQQRTGKAVQLRALRNAQVDFSGDCYANAFAGVASDINPNSDSFSTSFDIDFGACAESGLTGSVKVSMSAKLNQGSGTFEYNADYTMNQVCTTGDAKICQDGSISMEGEGSIGADVNMTIIAAWDMTISSNVGGASSTIADKGGMEMKMSGDSVSLRIVAYVTNTAGEEVSYTLSLMVDDSSGSFSIKGKDGELTCTVNNEGGSCTGDAGMIQWGAGDS